MADVKISALPAATSIASTDVAPVVTGGITKKASADAIVKAVLPAPGPIGATTADAGSFTSLSATGTATAQKFTSTVVTGTAPLTVASTTVVSNLNASFLEGYNTGTSGTKVPLLDGANTWSNNQIVAVSSASDALRITQAGAGNALVVEDSANPDATPFVVAADGKVLIGQTTSWATESVLNTSGGYNNGTFLNNSFAYNYIFTKSRSTTPSTKTIVQSGDALGSMYWRGDDGVGYIDAAQIFAAVDGTPGTNDMPGRLVFATTADGSSTPTERMRIDSAGNVGIGGAAAASTKFQIGGTINAAATSFGSRLNSTIDPSVVTTEFGSFVSIPTVSAGTLPDIVHFSASQGTFTGTVTRQYGFYAASTLTGATNDYGFHSNIAAGTGRWNFYANGTAANYFAGDIQLGKTVTAAGTTGAQTINKTVGSVNFAAAATSLVVTNNLVTTSSIITATVGSNDTTMKSVAVVAAAGSFTLYANAAPTAETRVNFHVFN